LTTSRDRQTKFLNKTVALISTGFALTAFTEQTDKIVGNYHYWTESSAIFTAAPKTTYDYYLTINKDFSYTEIIKVKGNNPNKCKEQGKWTVNQDTVILIPTKRKWKHKIAERPNVADKNGITAMADTFIYKEDALWKFNPSTKQLTYRKYKKIN